MPTATATVTKSPHSAQLPLKIGAKPSTPSSLASTPTPSSPTTHTSTTATLRSLYNRAARAFVQRDIPLTYSLIQSGFALLKPPNHPQDPLLDHRRKWDILRITFESTVYTSPPASTEALPEPLRAMLVESGPALSSSIYSRSLALFTPAATTLNAAYLPSQVLTTLVYSSLKLDAADVGRTMIEDWLARREPEGVVDGYVKVLDLYCLHILPRLEQWDYAKEFLEYESEMPVDRRERIKISLSGLYTQAMSSRSPFKPSVSSPRPYSPPASSPRSYSPAASSSSSSSSSLSTTSTHTVVPTHRSLTAMSSVVNAPSISSSSSSETATPRVSHPTPLPAANGFPPRSARQQSKSRTTSSSASSSFLPRDQQQLAHQVSVRSGAPSIYALIRVSLAPYLTSKKTVTFLVLCILVPLVSFVLRVRRRRRLVGLASGGAAGMVGAVANGASVSAGNAEMVRRRLQAAGGDGGLIQRAWGEVVRVVGDTVKMAGSGLV